MIAKWAVSSLTHCSNTFQVNIFIYFIYYIYILYYIFNIYILRRYGFVYIIVSNINHVLLLEEGNKLSYLIISYNHNVLKYRLSEYTRCVGKGGRNVSDYSDNKQTNLVKSTAREKTSEKRDI